MIFKRTILAVTVLMGLGAVVGHFFLSRENKQLTPQTDAKDKERTIEDKASTADTGPGSGKDRIGKAAYEEEESVEELERRAIGHPDPEERMEAVLELSQREDGKKSIWALVAILHNDKEEDVREAALDALEEIQGLSFDVVAKVALNDPEPSLRIRAIEILGEMSVSNKRTIDVLKRIGNTDKDEQVRESAKDLLE